MKILFSFLLILAFNAAAQEINKSRLDSAIIFTDKLIETNPNTFFKNVRSMIVWHKQKILFEKYYNGFSKDSLNHIQSQTKSIIALLMGIAIDKEYVKNVDEPVSKYFSGNFKEEDSLKSSVKIKDILTMSAGFKWQEFLPFDDPDNDNINMFNSDNYLQYAVSRQMADPPFRKFNYNSGCPVIAAGIIEKACGMKLEKFAEKYLFDPLGIKEYYWIKDKTGFCHAGGGLFLKPADMLKIGILVHNKGKYEDRQVVSEQWVNNMTHPYFPTSIDNADYGYFWWVNHMKTTKGNSVKMVSAQGAGGQRLYIFPEYDLIVAFTENNYTTPLVSPLMIKEGILPLLE